MADPLTIIGGVASVTQIIGVIASTIGGISALCDHFEDAPVEFMRMRQILYLTRCTIDSLKEYLFNHPDNDVIPLELRAVCYDCIRLVAEDIDNIRKHVPVSSPNVHYPGSIKSRLKWATLQRKTAQQSLDRLKQSETMLLLVMQHLNFRLLLFQSPQKSNDADTPRAERSQGRKPVTDIISFVLATDHWLRSLGFFGSYNYISGPHHWRREFKFGIHLPTWLCLKSILIELQLASAPAGISGIRLLPSQICLQNRVPRDSQFMVACRNGDVPLMLQHLKEGTGRVHDRTICSGKTPLLLAIESENLDSVRMLLENGANPDMGDDNQILPVFSVIGLRPSRNRRSRLAQCPPEWEFWLQALQLLVAYNASVHETVHGHVMGAACILRPTRPDKTIEYFRLLSTAGYVDFPLIGTRGASALRSAIRSSCQGVDSIKLLQKEGVDLTKILDGGQSFLHVAAQLAENVAVLEYIYTNGCQQYLNRQDNWGWTPLHWSVVSQAAMSGSGKSRIANFSFLLSQGADPTIKAHESDIIPWGFLPWQEFTAIELAISIDPDLFKEVLDELRQQTPEAFTKENDPFHFKEINDKLINQYEDGNIEHMSDPNLG